MGQYHVCVSLTKKEFLNPHKLGDGLKLMEQGGQGGVATALLALLAVSNGRGGGDMPDRTIRGERVVGRWGGDRIAIVGDYAERGDFPREPGDPSPEDVYSLCFGEDPKFRDITDLVCEYLSIDHGYLYVGDGWRTRIGLWDDVTGFDTTCYGDEEHGRQVLSGGRRFWQADVMVAIGKAIDAREARPIALATLTKKYGLKEVKR